MSESSTLAKVKEVLANPTIYQSFQVAGGFFAARVKAIGAYLGLQPGQRIIDIGCGPGHIVAHLPAGVIYDGFDPDQKYIDFANRRFGGRARFHCGMFDDRAAAEFGAADVVMMNGVLHHMDDSTVRITAELVVKALKSGGTWFAMDPVYVPGQNRIAKWLVDGDRGRFVRTQPGYRDLLTPVFPDATFHVHDDLAMVPYTFIVSLCHKGDEHA